MFYRRLPLWQKCPSINKNIACVRCYSSFKDPYTVLGVGREASSSDIKRAYFDLVKKYHPDTNKNPEASTKFIEIQNAYEILSDPKRKDMFDHYGTTNEAASQAGGGYGGQSADFDPTDIFRNIFTGGGRGSSGAGFEEMFRGAFDRSSSPYSSAIDLDVSTTMKLSFLEAAKGTAKTVSFTRLEPCASCHGSGLGHGSKKATCKTCRGSGNVTKVRGPFYFSSTCRSCRGTGQINTNPCGPCQGHGSVKRNVSVNVQVPAGLEDGETFSIRSEGSFLDGKKGDLFITVSVEKSDTFLRKRNDIHLTIPITLLQAIKGGSVQVPTIDGNVELKVPAGSQPDDIKRLSGRGIFNESTRERGHQFVKLKVEIPRNLTEEQLKSIQRILDPNYTEVHTENQSSSSSSSSNPENTSSTDGKDNDSSLRKWFAKFWPWH